jgi:hypothetical protein
MSILHLVGHKTGLIKLWLQRRQDFWLLKLSTRILTRRRRRQGETREDREADFLKRNAFKQATLEDGRLVFGATLKRSEYVMMLLSPHSPQDDVTKTEMSVYSGPGSSRRSRGNVPDMLFRIHIQQEDHSRPSLCTVRVDVDYPIPCRRIENHSPLEGDEGEGCR